MQAEALAVIHADDALLVLDKPAGLLAVPGRGADKQDCLSKRAQALYPDALVVHRLDMATSGLMLMARGAAAQRHLSRAFADRRVHKSYIALVHGRLAQRAGAWGVIDLPIAVDWPNRPRRIVPASGGKASVTRWRVLPGADAQDTTRVELEPVTGRSHQLRVHMLAIGHHIVGDPLYTVHADFPPAERLMLHATRIEFAHPFTLQTMGFTSAPGF